MSTIKQKITPLVTKYALLRALHTVYLMTFRRGRIGIVKDPTFQGWGMVTTTGTPWQTSESDVTGTHFTEADMKLRSLVEAKRFQLTQFAHMFKDKDEFSFLDELRWRHYVVYWSAEYAVRMTSVETTNIVECGVCDGLTMYFAMSAARRGAASVEGHLYDAWEGMRPDLLSDSEERMTGEYDYLDIETTRENLVNSGIENCLFNKGFIPEIFATKEGPENLVWLHIDLNSSGPTINAMDHFWGRLANGGVILLDDYALVGYDDTKVTVDKWLVGKDALFLHFPTGQGLIIKR
jgi:hypothetical protein